MRAPPRPHLHPTPQARGEDEFGAEGEAGADGGEGGEGEGKAGGSGLPWDGSDRDYTYEELLGELGWAISFCVCVVVWCEGVGVVVGVCMGGGGTVECWWWRGCLGGFWVARPGLRGARLPGCKLGAPLVLAIALACIAR